MEIAQANIQPKMERYKIGIPSEDVRLMHSLMKKMGWDVKKEEPNSQRLDTALRAAHGSGVCATNDIRELVDGLMK